MQCRDHFLGNRRGFVPFLYSARIVAGLVLPLLLVACQNPPADQNREIASIRVVYSHEIRPWAANVLEHFVATSPALATGALIKLDSHMEHASLAARRIARGELKTEAWIAPSSTLVEYVNRSLVLLGPPQVDCKPLFGTPVVLAVAAQHADAIATQLRTTSVEREFNLSELRNMVKSSVLAEPSTTTPSLLTTVAHSIPNQLIAGFAVFLQLARAAKPNSLSPLDRQAVLSADFAARLSELEYLFAHYEAVEQQLLTKVLNADRKPLLALTTEQHLIQFNQTVPDASKRLLAFYLRGEVVWNDYQLCLSNADWVTPAHRAAFSALAEFAQSEAAQQLAMQLGFRPVSYESTDDEDRLSSLGARLDRARNRADPIAGEAVASLLDLWPRVSRPSSMVILLDTSGSTEGEVLGNAKAALRSLLARQDDRAQRALIAFSTEVQLEEGFGASSATLIRKLDPLQASGGSAIYDAIRKALELLSEQNKKDYRRSILLVTDGGDKSSRTTFDQLRTQIDLKLLPQDIDLTIVAIQSGSTDFSDLKQIAARAQGVIRIVSPSQVEGIIREVMDRL